MSSACIFPLNAGVSECYTVTLLPCHCEQFLLLYSQMFGQNLNKQRWTCLLNWFTTQPFTVISMTDKEICEDLFQISLLTCLEVQYSSFVSYELQFSIRRTGFEFVLHQRIAIIHENDWSFFFKSIFSFIVQGQAQVSVASICWRIETVSSKDSDILEGSRIDVFHSDSSAIFLILMLCSSFHFHSNTIRFQSVCDSFYS